MPPDISRFLGGAGKSLSSVTLADVHRMLSRPPFPPRGSARHLGFHGATCRLNATGDWAQITVFGKDGKNRAIQLPRGDAR
jgi:hypothetical protein